jgi:Gpi18-like mannosyltransferase
MGLAVQSPSTKRTAGRTSIRWIAAAAVVIVLAGLAVRWPWRNELTTDVRFFFAPWYDVLTQNGGFTALRFPFYNYNPPYLYLLTVGSWLPVPELVAIKLIPTVFDLLLGYAGYLIVRQSTRGHARALLAAALLVLAPTVVLNSAWWGQCDSIYAAFSLLALHHQLRNRTVLAWALLGVAVGFKLQALFVVPVLLTVMACRGVRVRTALAAGAAFVGTFFALLVPAWLAGASWADLLRIYPAQVTASNTVALHTLRDLLADPSMPYATGGAHAAGAAPPAAFSYNAASAYQWLSSDAGRGWFVVGFVAVAVVIGGAGLLAFRHRHALGPRALVAVAAFQSTAIPFLLPAMHDRYFYLADALLIAAACVLPRLIPAAVLAQAASLAGYAVILWGAPSALLPFASGAELLALVVAGLVAWTQVRTVEDGHRLTAAMDAVG